MNPRDLQTWSTDFVAFATAAMRALGEPMHDYQADFVAKLAPALHALKAKRVAECRKYWCEWTKGSGKDRVLALAVVWAVAFYPWPVEVVVSAVDLEQAKELKKRARDALKTISPLGRLVRLESEKIVNTRGTDGVCEIVPSDRHGSHGGNPDLTICNEIAHQVDATVSQNLLDNSAKSKHGIVICASNAGSILHWSWPWRENARQGGPWCFHQYAQPAPHISSEDLVEAERRNPPSRFKRLYWGVWASGSGDALSGEWIDRAVVLDGPTHKHPGAGWRTVAGLDAGTRRDFTALVILAKHVGCYELLGEKPLRLSRMQRLLIDAGEMLPPVVHSPGHLQAWADRSVGSRPGNEYRVVQPTNKLRLLWCKVWRPDGCEVDLELVEREVLRCRKVYKLRCVAFDPWQLTGTAQRLRRQGVRMDATDPTGGNLSAMARELMGGFSDNRIELYNDEGLLRDLRSMSLVERSYGVRVESPRSREHGHADLGTAFCLALLAASRIKGDRMRRESEIVTRLREAVGA